MLSKECGLVIILYWALLCSKCPRSLVYYGTGSQLIQFGGNCTIERTHPPPPRCTAMSWYHPSGARDQACLHLLLSCVFSGLPSHAFGIIPFILISGSGILWVALVMVPLERWRVNSDGGLATYG